MNSLNTVNIINSMGEVMVPWAGWNKIMGPRPWGHQALRRGYDFMEENNEAENVVS